MSPVEPAAGGVRLRVLVQPRAGRSELAGIHGDRLRVRLGAPPVDGAANDELCRLLAGLLDVARGRVVIQSGARGRRKTVLVEGMTPAQAIRALRLPP